MDMYAAEHEVRDKSLALLREANDAREEKLVDQLITQSAKNHNAILGLDDTLQAVNDGRVDTLILSDGFRMAGYVHEASDFLVANLAKSPLTEEELRPVADVVDHAVNRTIAQSGRVEVISENPQLEGAGRIGALLRY